MPKLTKNYILFLAIILLFSVYLGTFSGGFLTPSQRHEMTTLPGIEKIKSELISPEFSPSIPYHLGNYYGWSMVTNNTKFDEGLRSPKEYIYRLFLVILESFQVIFFPLLGLLLILYLYKTAPKYQLFAIVTFIALTCGLLLVWPMKLYGSKWTLTRFLIPGYFFAQISFCISLFYFFQKLSRKTQILIFGSVAFLMCQGPIKNFTEVLSNNISHSKDLKERLKSMTEYKNIPTK